MLSNPNVVNIEVSTAPSLPAGLQLGAGIGPAGSPASTMPVIKWNNYTYLACSYLDNRMAFAVVAYDPKGNVAKQWEVNGPRYIWNITVDDENSAVIFFGQSSDFASMTWDQLRLPS